jgi:hypothetical protein
VTRARWDAALYVNNLTDERALLSLDRERGTRARVGFLTNQPRTAGVTLSSAAEPRPPLASRTMTVGAAADGGRRVAPRLRRGRRRRAAGRARRRRGRRARPRRGRRRRRVRGVDGARPPPRGAARDARRRVGRRALARLLRRRDARHPRRLRRPADVRRHGGTRAGAVARGGAAVGAPGAPRAGALWLCAGDDGYVRRSARRCATPGCRSRS